jgi:hypothetical protein
MSEILDFFERTTGDTYLGIAVFFTVTYILYFPIATWLGVLIRKKRNMNAEELKKLLRNIGFLVANLAVLILVVNILKSFNLTESMTQKLTIGSFLFFMMPIALKVAVRKDLVR